jgi:nucleoside-diphosphate-sugar epimerase
MSWKGRRVLVTGAAGFIGRHLASRLLAEGAETRLLIRYSSLPTERLLPAGLHKHCDVRRGDIRDRDLLQQACRGMETVFHLAALVGIPYSYEAPLEVLAVNAGGTAAVLEAARCQGVARLVCTSTSEVYGTAQTVPIPEDHPLNAQSPYAASKTAADQLALAYHRSFELPVALLRPFNTYGPGQSARAVIPTILRQALDEGPIHLGNLQATRDFTYVEDTVEGFLRAATVEAAIGRVTQIGSGREITIGELARRICSLAGVEARILTQAGRLRPAASEVERLCCDNRPARERLGWTPSVSLAEGLRRVIAWVREHGHELGDGYAV